MRTVLKKDNDILEINSEKYNGVSVVINKNKRPYSQFIKKCSEEQYQKDAKSHYINQGYEVIEEDKSEETQKIYEYIYILNYNTGSLQVIKLTKEDEELYEDDIECILVDYGLNIDEVSWMISDRELEVEELEKIEK